MGIHTISLMSLVKDNFTYNLSIDSDFNYLELSQVNNSMIIKQGEFVESTIRLPTELNDFYHIRDGLDELIKKKESKHILDKSFEKLRSFKNFDKDIIESLIKEISNVKFIEDIYVCDENDDNIGVNFITKSNNYCIEYYPTLDDTMKEFLYLTIYDKKDSDNLLRFFKEKDIETIFKLINEFNK